MTISYPKAVLVPRGVCLRGHSVRLWVVVCLTVLGGLVAGQAQEALTNGPFRAGFSVELLKQFNENDAKAAIKVWVEALIHESAFQADSTAVIYNNVADIATALQKGELDGVTMLVRDLFEIRSQIKFDRCTFDLWDGSVSDDYVLLVRQDSPFLKVEDLQNHTLNILQAPRMSMAIPWLDVLLMEKGLKPAKDFFGRVNEQTKLTQTVLPVFFRQADCCVASRKGFKTMGELNPQVSKQLRVLASSPALAATVFVMRTGFSKVDQDRIMQKIMAVHQTAAGKQVLTVFQTERIEERPASFLDGTFALLERRQQLLLALTNSIPSPAPVPAHTATNGGVL